MLLTGSMRTPEEAGRWTVADLWAWAIPQLAKTSLPHRLKAPVPE